VGVALSICTDAPYAAMKIVPRPEPSCQQPPFSAGCSSCQAELHTFDIILLDVMLPGLNGFEVTKRLRMQRIRTPIVLLTARDAPEDVLKGLDAGADDYLTKPFDFEVCWHASVHAHAGRREKNRRRCVLPTCSLTPKKREAAHIANGGEAAKDMPRFSVETSRLMSLPRSHQHRLLPGVWW
jgi:DNA-binding response OmpR family regulator